MDARAIGFISLVELALSMVPLIVCVFVMENLASSLTREPLTKPPKTRNDPSLKSLITWSSRGSTS